MIAWLFRQGERTLIDAELLREVKRAAAEDGKRLCDLFAEALAGYLAERAPEPRRAMQAYRRFCSNPIGGMGAGMDDLREILDDVDVPATAQHRSP